MKGPVGLGGEGRDKQTIPGYISRITSQEKEEGEEKEDSSERQQQHASPAYLPIPRFLKRNEKKAVKFFDIPVYLSGAAFFPSSFIWIRQFSPFRQV